MNPRLERVMLGRLFGFRPLLVLGDALVLDRWLWLTDRLPETANGEELVDVGCGNGAFTIGLSGRGYRALGLTWDAGDAERAGRRAVLCRAPSARFEIQDVRQLDSRTDLSGGFDVAVCTENIEHILDDFKLIRDISALLRPGGRLLLTTPNAKYRPMSQDDKGPFPLAETGAHVRRGYSKSMLVELAGQAGLIAEEVTFCSGLFSQKLTALQRKFNAIQPLLGSTLLLPFRLFSPLMDHFLQTLIPWPPYSICIEAYKPRVPAGSLPQPSPVPSATSPAQI